MEAALIMPCMLAGLGLATARQKGDLNELDLVPGTPLPTVSLETDRGRLNMIVDTGSEVCSLPKAGPFHAVMPNGQTVSDYAMAQKDTRSVLEVFQKRCEAREGGCEVRPDGVLGETFLEQFRQVSFDNKRRKLVLIR